jgi:tetratricopeptide (TPR) repeat protein
VRIAAESNLASSQTPASERTVVRAAATLLAASLQTALPLAVLLLIALSAGSARAQQQAQGARGSAVAASAQPKPDAAAKPNAAAKPDPAAKPDVAAKPDFAAKPDPAALARARAAFQLGVAASTRRDYAKAATHFQEALALHYAPATAFNLASALYELRQFPEAYNHVQSVLAAETAPASVRERAQTLEQTLQLEVARLTVVTSGTLDDVSAQVDGEALPPEMLGRARAVTPGIHEVAALRAGEVISRREVDIAVRTTALVDLSLIVAAARPEPVLAPAAPPSARADSGPSGGSWYKRHRKVLWLSVAAGVVVGGAAVATALLVGGDSPEEQAPVRGDTGVLSW